jgi:hypothetical protein
MDMEENKTDLEKKPYIKNIVFAAAALVAIVLLTIAWFVNNTRVTGNGVQISANQKSFELRSYGKNGIYDDLLGDFLDSVSVWNAESDTSETNTSEAGTSDNSYTTTAEKASISWLMSDQSNMGNDSDKEIDFSTEDRKDYAIEPGSEGRLTFYIVPGTNGTQTFQIHLSVVPYQASTEESTNKITAIEEVGKANDNGSTTGQKQYAREFISGHILFFQETTAEDGTKQDTWLKDRNFEVTITDAVADQEYAYTIYWKWPQVFSEIILNGGDDYLDGRKPILTSTIRENILADMKKNPQKYFYNSLTSSPLSTKDELIGEIDKIHASSQISGEMAQNFVDLSSFYNQADQIIGSQISFILVELSAEAGGSTQ